MKYMHFNWDANDSTPRITYEGVNALDLMLLTATMRNVMLAMLDDKDNPMSEEACALIKEMMGGDTPAKLIDEDE